MITLPIWLLIVIVIFGLPLLVGLISLLVMYIKVLITIFKAIIELFELENDNKDERN